MNGPTPILTSPLLNPSHQEPTNPTTATAFLYNKPPNFCLRIGHQQVRDIDMNPANHMPVRQLCDKDRVAFVLLNPIETSLHLLLSCRVTQLLTENSEALGIPCISQSNNSLTPAVRLHSQRSTTPTLSKRMRSPMACPISSSTGKRWPVSATYKPISRMCSPAGASASTTRA